MKQLALLLGAEMKRVSRRKLMEVKIPVYQKLFCGILQSLAIGGFHMARDKK